MAWVGTSQQVKLKINTSVPHQHQLSAAPATPRDTAAELSLLQADAAVLEQLVLDDYLGDYEANVWAQLRSRQRARQRNPAVAAMAAAAAAPTVEDMWQRMDADKSGQVDLDEIQKLTKDLGAKMKKKEIKKMLAEVDADGDGQVSRDEFEAFWLSRDGGGAATAAAASSLGPVMDRLQSRLEQEAEDAAKQAGNANKKKARSLQKVHSAECGELTAALAELRAQIAAALQAEAEAEQNAATAAAAAALGPGEPPSEAAASPAVQALLTAAAGPAPPQDPRGRPAPEAEKMAGSIRRFSQEMTDLMRRLTSSADIVATGGSWRAAGSARLAKHLLVAGELAGAWLARWERRYKDEPPPGGLARAQADRAAWQKEEDSRAEAERLDVRAAELAAELSEATAAELEAEVETICGRMGGRPSTNPDWMQKDTKERAAQAAVAAAELRAEAGRLADELAGRQAKRVAVADAEFAELNAVWEMDAAGIAVVMFRAVVSEDSDLLRRAIEAGADVAGAKNRAGETAVEVAATREKLKPLFVLLDEVFCPCLSYLRCPALPCLVPARLLAAAAPCHSA
eukprot:SAG22_NODE_57_length_23647_cov_11.746688_6_plen_571_part_00